MARSSPQSFEKRRRERDKQQKRAEKLERRQDRTEVKRADKAEGIDRTVETDQPREDDSHLDR